MHSFRSPIYIKQSVKKGLIVYLEEKTQDTRYDIRDRDIFTNGKTCTAICFLGKSALYKYFIQCNIQTLDVCNQLEEIARFLQKRVFYYNMITRSKEELLVNLRIAVTMLEKIPALSRREKDAIFDSITDAFYGMYKLVNNWYLEYVIELPFIEADQNKIPF